MSGLWHTTAREPRVPSWSIAGQRRVQAPFSARLPSRDEGLCFHADFEMTLTVTPWDAGQRQQAVSEARTVVVGFAAKETERFTVADVGNAEVQLGEKLATEDVVLDSRIRSTVVTVKLTADDADIELVRRRERLAPEDAIVAERHRLDMRHLGRLADDVYRDPLQVLRWWYSFGDTPERVSKLDAIARQLSYMVDGTGGSVGDGAALNGAATLDDVPELAGGAVAELLRDLDGADRAAVRDRLAGLCVSFGRHDLARRMSGGP